MESRDWSEYNRKAWKCTNMVICGVTLFNDAMRERELQERESVSKFIEPM